MGLKKMGMGLLFFCLVGVLVSGCGDGKPSDKDGEKKILKSYEECSRYFSVENFKKNNGYESQPNTYVFEVEYDVVAKEDSLVSKLPFRCSLVFGPNEVRKGAVKHIKTKINFIKKENGWEAR